MTDHLILIKGAGDLATGVAWRLHRCGFPVVMTELAGPLCVRRTVSFAQAVFDGEWAVEGITARRVSVHDVPDTIASGEIPVVVDPAGEAVDLLQPTALIDAIMAKRNLGTAQDQAPLVLALGPGFVAGKDCHGVIETHRGHSLGRVIWQGAALANTGDPGSLPGLGAEPSRVLRSQEQGHLRPHFAIGDGVASGSVIATLVTEKGEELPILAPFSGVLRGLIHPSIRVWPGLKIGDLDPRLKPSHAHTISDKSLAIAGGVLEALLSWLSSAGMSDLA
jgi:xanthine dehydrogenase accessory factor